MRQLAGTRTRYRWADSAPGAGLIFDRVQINAYHCDGSLRVLRRAICDLIFTTEGTENTEKSETLGIESRIV